MFREFNDGAIISDIITYRGTDYEFIAFEEQTHVDIKRALGFNLIAIEFDKSVGTPFNSIVRKASYNGYDSFGYIVDLENNDVYSINLCIPFMSWTQTEEVGVDSEEYIFVKTILKQINAIL